MFARAFAAVRAWLAFAVLVLPAVAAVAGGPLADRQLVVGSEQDLPPFAEGTTDDTADGFTVELWRAVAREEGLRYRLVVKPFAALLEGLKSGEIDVMLNLAQSDDRRAFADFAVPHARVDGGIFVRRSGPAISSESELAEKSVIVIRSGLAHDYAAARGWHRTLVLVDNAFEGLTLLSSGQHDAMLLGKLTGMQALRKFGLSNIRLADANAGFAQKFSFAVRKGDADLLAALNDGLALSKANGTYDALYEKWFGVYESETAYRRGFWVLVQVFAAAVMGATAILFYRRKVERSRSQEALRDSEARFRSLTELSSDWYWEQDDQLRFVFTSSRYEAEDGLCMRSVIGQTRWEVDQIWESDEHLRRHRATLEGRMPFHELYLRRRDGHGELRHLLVSGVPVFDGGGRFTGYRGIGRDVTQQRKTTESLRDSERRIETVINNIPATIGYWDDRARLVFGNRAMEALFGAPLDRLVGRTLRDILGEEAFKVAGPHVEAVLRGEPRTFERTAPPPDGPPRRLQIQVIPDLGDGRVKGFFALTTDITELSELVEERTRDLNAAKQRAEAASRAKDDFLANVSHEMRTPLHAIKAFTSLSLRRLEHTKDDKLARFLKNTDDSARRLHLFVEDLLSLAKHQAGQHLASRESVDVVERIASIQRHLEALLAARDLTVEVRAETVDPIVPADAGMIDQIVTNLLSNAIKFSPEGGTISIVLGDDSVAVDGDRTVPALRLAVSDRGLGIPESEFESIFNKFEQSSRTKTGAGGTGLGLAICREIATRHGGRIFAGNNAEGGATFVLLLPRAVTERTLAG